ncbi:MAG: hypothetical protein KJ000_18685 [Pirellulaceae bacterium]|nr:hypothetical protein [Pirellulaceae bacterium]
MPHAPLDSQSPQRMLGAIIPNQGQAWFFKVNGAPDELVPHVSAFKDWLKTIRFDGGKPSWQLPGNWRQMPASGMRFATVRLGPEEDALELTVIPLSIEGDPTQNILANVNRWRGQLNLGPIREDELAENTEAIPINGLTATFVDFVNQGSSLASGSPSSSAAATTTPPASGVGSGVELQAPEGWTAAPLMISRGGITIRHEAAFEVTDGAKRLEFTLDRLPGAGSLTQNVNRWSGQIGLEPLDADEVGRAIQKLDLGGVAAEMIELKGEQETILGIVAVRGTEAWYFKLKGDNELAEREKENFLALARSVKFP